MNEVETFTMWINGHRNLLTFAFVCVCVCVCVCGGIFAQSFSGHGVGFFLFHLV